MEIINGLDFQIKNSAVSLGKFDGIHQGHRLLLRKILEPADLNPTVFTFDGIFSGKRIYTGREQSLLLERLGIARKIIFPFRAETKSMTAEQFVREVLVGRMDARLICTGEDFRFGRDRQGDVDLLSRFSDRYGYELYVYPKLRSEGEIVSSTRIRKELLEGSLETANQLLDGPYFISGEVRHGRALGRTIGLPTANIMPAEEKLLPVYGVYATTVEVEGRNYAGVTNLGVKPTVGSDTVSVETTLLDFDGDLYGKEIIVYFHHFLRREKRFDDLEQLKAQIEQDKARAAQLLDIRL